MNIIAVDDEKPALNSLQSAIQGVLPNSSLSCFNISKQALEYAKNNRVDIAFLDIEMSGMNGLMLAKQLKDIYGKTIIIFVTGHSHYTPDAFSLHAGGYILKPVTAKAVSEATEYLRNPVLPIPEPKKPPEHFKTTGSGGKLRVQTFGNFEVFANGKPLIFARTKSKEAFAYLVSRQGAICNNNEVIAVIWEDKDDTHALKSMFRILVADLTQTLKKAGFHDVFIKQRGHIGIMTEKISCDLYDFCAGINVNNYMGEYMTQYGWAEFTNIYLDRMKDKIIK